jgi:myo-inositol-1(or 4)-monophosphatase
MINTAIRAAKSAGKIITENFDKNFDIHTKDGNKRNLVTSVDLAAEKEIIKILKEDFPDYDILSEESQPDKNKIENGFVWIIDPIDGTTNYSRGIKDVTVAIALAENKKVILGVVYNPFTKELFTAENGKGAFLNGKVLNVSIVKQLEDAIVAQSFAYSNKFRKDPLKNINKLFLTVNGIRLYHSTELELCYLASGRIDACVISGSNPWDIAAGSLIVEEAGGKVTKFNGEKWDYLNGRIIATNKHVHQDLLNLING